MKIFTEFAYLNAWHFATQEAHGMSLDTRTRQHSILSRQRAA